MLESEYLTEYTLQTSYSTGNFATSIDNHDSIGTADSLSMSSAMSSATESGPSSIQSLSSMSVGSKTTLTPSTVQQAQHQPFVPHIVLLNSILNYLSVSILILSYFEHQLIIILIFYPL